MIRTSHVGTLPRPEQLEALCARHELPRDPAAFTLQFDLENLRRAVDGLEVQPFLSAVAPGTIEHWLWNEHYKTDEECLFAIADAMHEEYKAITDAGVLLQIDDPDGARLATKTLWGRERDV